MRDEGYGSSSILLAFLLGGAVGAGFAFLLAPKSGRELRHQLRDLAGETREKAHHYLDETKGRVTSAIEKGKDMLEEQKSAVNSAIEAGKEAYHKEKERHLKG